MIPLSLLSSVWPESSEGCAGLSVNNMDSYEVRQDAIEKMLLAELEANSQNIDICDIDTSNNEYVPSEHSDQEDCDHVSPHETGSDGDNVTASDDNDTAYSENISS